MSFRQDLKLARGVIGREPGKECPRQRAQLEQRPWGRRMPGMERLEDTGSVTREEDHQGPGGGRVALEGQDLICDFEEWLEVPC